MKIPDDVKQLHWELIANSDISKANTDASLQTTIARLLWHHENSTIGPVASLLLTEREDRINELDDELHGLEYDYGRLEKELAEAKRLLHSWLFRPEEDSERNTATAEFLQNAQEGK